MIYIEIENTTMSSTQNNHYATEKSIIQPLSLTTGILKHTTHHDYQTINPDEGGADAFDNDQAASASIIDRMKKAMLSVQQYIQKIPPAYLKTIQLVFFVVMLVFSTTFERITFKVTIDRMIPYKFILIQIIFLFSFIFYALLTLYKYYYTKEIAFFMWNFSQHKIFMMALLDTCAFLLLVYSTSGVFPIMTAVLMHIYTPVIYIVNKITGTQQTNTTVHLVGIICITVAVLLGLCKSIVYFVTESMEYSTVNHPNHDSSYTYEIIQWNFVASFLYVLAAALQGLISMYKEQSILRFSQPMNIYLLSSMMFLHQFIITFVMSVIFYLIQGMV